MSSRVNRVAPAPRKHRRAGGTSNPDTGAGLAADASLTAPAIQAPPPDVARAPGASGELASGPGWTLHRGDCLALTADLPDDSVDVVITDPPYDEHTHKSGRRGSIGKRDSAIGATASFNRSRNLGFKALKHDDMTAAAEQFARISKRWSLVFCTVEMVGDSATNDGHGWRAAGERAGLEYVRTCVWHKLGATPQFTGDRPAQAVEAIVCFHRPGRKRWNGGGKHGYYAHPIVLNRGGSSERLHTTQKPLSLMRELVEDFTEPGELVLDAYAGSGTTGVAAVNLGRRFHGIELAACARCAEPAVFWCSWTEGRESQGAYMCSYHRDLASVFDAYQERRENYFSIAARRLRGDEAKPRREQPGLFDLLAGVGE